MTGAVLRVAEAARRLDMPTKQLLELVHCGEISVAMLDGIAHVPASAVEEYRTNAPEHSGANRPHRRDGSRQGL